MKCKGFLMIMAALGALGLPLWGEEGGPAVKQVAGSVVMPVPIRVAWLMNETLDGQPTAAPVLPTVWGNELLSLRFSRVAPEIEDRLRQACPAADLMAKKYCAPLTSLEADLLIAGEVAGVSKPAAPGSTDVGVQVTATVNVFQVDSEAFLFEMKRPGYKVAPNAADAFSGALRQTAPSVAIQLSNMLTVRLNQQAEGTLVVNAITDRKVQDDLMIGLRFASGVRDVRLIERGKDSLALKLDYAKSTWAGLIDLVNASQGAGVTAKVTGTLKAEATYNPGLAFRMLIAVGETLNLTKDPAVDEIREPLALALEAEFAKLPGAIVVPFPVRMKGNGYQVAREMTDMYGGDMVVVASLTKKKEDVILTVDVVSTHGGAFFSLNDTLVNLDFAPVIRKTVETINGNWNERLTKIKPKLTKLKQTQYDAWVQKKGG